jgi:REP element-mobilizing transposase RayT
VLQQFQETARYRKWELFAAAIMTNHVHLVVGVGGDSDPTKVLGDFKSYASRALNRASGNPGNGTWWTYAGSKRKLKDEAALAAAINYLKSQQGALVIWVADRIES